MKLIQALTTFALMSTLGACTNDTSEDVASTSESESALSKAEQIKQLKQQIVAVSEENMTRTDNFEAVESKLRPLIKKLVTLSPRQPQKAELKALEGSWHQLWSNLTNPMPGFLSNDLRQVYQVVSSDGYYYNFGKNKAFKLLSTTAVLRGKYSVIPEGFAVEFTKVGFRVGSIDEDSNLVKLMSDLENNDATLLSISSGKAPKGPVGIKGKLTTIYVDSDLRIAGGEQTPFLDENGKELVPGKKDLLFVLERSKVQ